LLANFKADEARTSLADAVLEILQRKDGVLPAAMVVVTDGRDNASKYTLQEAALECARRGVPLHIYGVGSADAASLQLKEVGVPTTIFVDDAITVPLRWRAQGLGKGTITVTVQLGTKIVAKRDVPLQTGEDLRDSITFTVPKGQEKEADTELKVSLRVKGKDAFKDEITRPVRVEDRKIRVLYIENSPRFVYQFLMAALLRDRRVEPSFLLVSADPKVARSGPPFLAEFPPTREKFFAARYNVIILGDVAAGFLGKEHLEWIKEFVQNRGGLIAIAGRKNMPAGYENTPLAEVLPAEFAVGKPAAADDVRTQEYPVTLTAAGQRSDMLALADAPDDNLREWAKLPGFHWQYPLARLRPGGVSLLVNPRAKMGDQPMPVLASHYYGKGQVVFMGSDEAWRWRFNEADKVTNRFWGQIVYQLGLPSLLGDASSRVQMALDRAEAVLDRPGAVFVRLLDKDYNPRREAKVEATLIYLEAAPGQEKSRPLTLNALPGRPGEYRGELAHERPGRWQIKLAKPDEYTFPFHVDVPPRHELEETGLAEAALRDMARLSGGKFYREEDLHRLPGDITPQTTAFTRRQEIVLWNPLVMIVFVVLITSEWLLRKFSNLS
jgi:uncharacterized membrane protein